VLSESLRNCTPYLKDWHFVKDFPNVSIYETPEFFRDDWLNLYCDAVGKNDYRFLYCGSKGSYTPLHHDVLKSYSWSVNIFGTKLWILYPPSQCEYLLDAQKRKCITNVLDEASIDKEEYPNFHRTDPIVILQQKNEAIFVPSGWYHQVVNLEDTLSVNHNWFNAYCLQDISTYLHAELSATRNAIEDIRENRDSFALDLHFEDKCQQLMELNIGMNFYEWIGVLVSALSFRVKQEHEKENAEFMSRTLFDVKVVQDVSKRINQDKNLVAVLKSNRSDEYTHLFELIS